MGQLIHLPRNYSTPVSLQRSARKSEQSISPWAAILKISPPYFVCILKKGLEFYVFGWAIMGKSIANRQSYSAWCLVLLGRKTRLPGEDHES